MTEKQQILERVREYFSEKIATTQIFKGEQIEFAVGLGMVGRAECFRQVIQPFNF